MRGSLVWDCTTNITNNLLKYTELNIYKKKIIIITVMLLFIYFKEFCSYMYKF